MGGTVAQQLVIDYPKRVRALVLAETNYGTKSNRMLWIAGKSITILVRLLGMKRLSRMTAQLAKTPEGQAMVQAAFAPQVANPANFLNIAEANNEFDGKGQLSRIECPTLVLIAEQNRATHGMGRYMAKTIPGAWLVTIPNAGHLVNWDNTTAFNTAVLEFFGKVTHGS
jgi:pimeloyl-ACP methyl ester carboxylesterase